MRSAGKLLLWLTPLLAACVGGNNGAPVDPFGQAGAGGTGIHGGTAASGPAPRPATDPTWKTVTYEAFGLSFSYPPTWVYSDNEDGPAVRTPELEASGRTNGAELFVWNRDEAFASVQATWAAVQERFAVRLPELQLGQGTVVTIDGRQVIRASLSDTRDSAAGWVVVVNRGARFNVIVAQAVSGTSWATYEATFAGILGSFQFDD